MDLVRESILGAVAARVPSATIALLVAAMCLTTLVTVGRTAGAEMEVQRRLEAAGSRELVVTDNSDGGLVSASVVTLARGLGAVERAVGVSRPQDVVNGAIGVGGPQVPAWGVEGRLTDVARLTGGRWAGTGEAMLSDEARRALGMDHAAGWVSTGDTQIPVVGSFSPRSPFDEYSVGALVVGHETFPTVSLHVVAASASDASEAQRVVLDLVAAPRPDDLTVRSPTVLAEIQEGVTGDVGRFGRSLLVLVLLVGAGLVAVVVLADVLVRRRDLGRRRALGATRGVVLAVVALRVVPPALVGSTLGVALGFVAAASAGGLPPWNFALGTAYFSVMAAVLAALPPAAYAATRDPVRVLRTP